MLNIKCDGANFDMNRNDLDWLKLSFNGFCVEINDVTNCVI